MSSELQRVSKCSLMKLGKMQVTGFLVLHVHLHAPRPPFPLPKQNKKFNRRGLFISTELFASETFPVLIFGAIYSFSPFRYYLSPSSHRLSPGLQ